MASILMTVAALTALWRSEKEFNPNVGFEKRMTELSQKVSEEKIKNEMLLARIEDFKQEIATHFPEQKNWDTKLRDIASVIPHSAYERKVDKAASQSLLDDGKKLFALMKYEEATQKFLDVISRYPDSPSQLEASYYLVSAFYMTGNKQEALNWSEKMLSQFPENRWTGRALLVMADIYRDQNRKNDMLSVYQTLMDSFDDEDLKKDVKKKMSSLDM